MANRATLRERWSTFDEWRRQLATELRALPKTLADFREGVANFRVVANRLAGGVAIGYVLLAGAEVPAVRTLLMLLIGACGLCTVTSQPRTRS